MRLLLTLAVALAAGSHLAAGDPVASPVPVPEPKLPDGLYAEILTPRGALLAELYYTAAPLTVANFVGLAEGQLGPKPGAPFFSGLKFHRVVPNFVVQGGDPLGTGEGGPGYSFADEFKPGLRHDAAGVLSMANDGPDTNGSQFFITLRETNRLNYLHSVFGRLVRGLAVLPLIRQDDVITAVNIRRVGAAAQAFRADQAAFDRLAAATSKYSAAKEPGPTAQFDDPDKLLPAEPPRALVFQRKLANFARATGVKIWVRLHAKFNPETAGQRPGALAAAVAKKLGLTANDILALYFADTDQWALWIGEQRLHAFTGSPGTLETLMRDGVFQQAKQDFLTAARTQAELYTAEAVKALPPDKPPTPAQRLKYQVDAVLDGLILKFEPKS
jgi:cyclophilin family peptidyl-prolyl cis-trans isomerase